MSPPDENGSRSYGGGVGRAAAPARRLRRIKGANDLHDVAEQRFASSSSSPIRRSLIRLVGAVLAERNDVGPRCVAAFDALRHQSRLTNINCDIPSGDWADHLNRLAA